ncbi:MAG: thioesterase [Lachnospiraceae bacterium]|nr:thioesterase [Lachnospiraceae bacterium]
MYGYETRVRMTEADQYQQMTLTSVLNQFQDCSIFHSEDRGVGMSFLESRKRMWVLSSWKIVINRYPKMAERIWVETWPYAFGKMTGSRNFRMLDGQGEVLAYADSFWVYMNTERARPCRLDEDVSGAYEINPKLDMEYEDGHIMLPEGMREEEPFSVIWHQLDVNHHVNNGQYVLMAAEYLPEDFQIRQMRVEYRKSAKLDDRICPKVAVDGRGATVALDDPEGKPYAVIEFR